MPIVKNKQFRAKSIRGAKVEDLLIFMDNQIELTNKLSEDPYYRGMRDAFELTKANLIQNTKYEYVKAERG